MKLLLITEVENKHYILIKDFNKFMCNQTKHEHRKHFCMYGLQWFSSEQVLEKHRTNCMVLNDAQAIKMPEKGSYVQFENYHKQLPVPFVIYGDFEAITEKIKGCQPSTGKSYTEAYQQHTDCWCEYKVISCYDDTCSKPVQLYRGPDAVYKFMEKRLEEVKYCKKVVKKHFNKPLKMTNEDEEKI